MRNAAWDMALLRHWSYAAVERRQTNDYWLLYSLDQALLACASEYIGAAAGSAERLEVLRCRWSREWGEAAGRELGEIYAECVLHHIGEIYTYLRDLPYVVAEMSGMLFYLFLIAMTFVGVICRLL